MWKLLIADDEPKIRRGLRKIVDWNSHDVHVIGDAEDGEVALDLIERLEPDIILLDINMPFLNGLNLLEKMNNLNMNFIIIIISGYDEFSYAQKALEYNVFDYVLKPVSRENIEKIVIKALNKLKIIEEKNNYGKWVTKQLNENMEQLKINFFLEWFENKINEEEVTKQLKYFNIKFEKKLGIMIIKIIDKLNLDLKNNKWNDKLIEYAIGNMIKDIFKETETIVVFSDSRKNIIVLIDNIDIERLSKINVEIEEAINNYLKFNVIIEQRNITNGILQVKQDYLKLIEIIKIKNNFSPMVLYTINYIQANYYNNLNINHISEKLEVTSSYLSKILKKETGLSFIDFLTNTRIEKATQIMKDQSVKIYDVAELVGYSNQHYFCRAFKKIMGVSPTEYKRGK